MWLGGVHLQMFGGDEVGVGNQRGFVGHQGDLAKITPGRAGHVGGGQRQQLSLDLVQRAFGHAAAGGDDADPGVHIVLGLGQQVGGQHVRVGAVVGHHKYLARAGQLVDADLAEHLALGFIDVGVAGADDLVHRRHRGRAVGHGGNRLRAADAENAVGAGQVAAGDHGRVGIGRQAGDHLVAAGHLGRHQRHHWCRQDRVAAARHIGADALDRDHPVPQVHAGQGLHLQRQHGGELRLGEGLHVGDGKFGVGAGLRIERGQRGQPLGLAHLQCLAAVAIKAQRVLAHRGIAAAAHLGDHLLHHGFDRAERRVAGRGGRFDELDGQTKLGHGSFRVGWTNRCG